MSPRIAGAPRSRACRTASAQTSTPRTVRPRWARAAVSRPGPQPTSRVDPAHRSSRDSSPGRRSLTHTIGSTRRTDVPSSPTSCSELGRPRAAWRSAEPRMCSGAVTAMPPRVERGRGRRPRTVGRTPDRRRRERRPPCRRRAASDRTTTRRPRSPSAAVVARPVSAVDIGTRRRAAAARGSRRPNAHQPPSSAGPMTASAPSSARPRSTRSSGVTCGVSMPMSRAAPTGRASTNACTSRSARPWPRCPTICQSAGGSSTPLTTSVRLAAGVRPTTSNVSSSAASATAAACTGVHGGHRRVFTVPGTGALAMTSSAGVMRLSTSRHVPHRPGRAEQTAGHLGHAAGPGCVVDVDLLDPPPGPSRLDEHLQRIAEPPVAQVQIEQGQPPRGSHRARGRAPGRRPTGAAARRWPRCRAEHGPGTRPDRTGRRRPSTRSARPVDDRPGHPGQLRRIEDPSASMKQTTSLVAASSPAWAAAPNPAGRASTTVAPWRRATRAEPSVEPLSTTIGRYPAGRRDSTSGSASASLRHGSTTSIIRITLGALPGSAWQQHYETRTEPYEPRTSTGVPPMVGPRVVFDGPGLRRRERGCEFWSRVEPASSAATSSTRSTAPAMR